MIDEALRPGDAVLLGVLDRRATSKELLGGIVDVGERGVDTLEMADGCAWACMGAAEKDNDLSDVGVVSSIAGGAAGA